MKKKTYAIEPQVNPTSRYYESDIDRAEGAPSPSVLSLMGRSDSRLLYLNSEVLVEK